MPTKPYPKIIKLIDNGIYLHLVKVLSTLTFKDFLVKIDKCIYLINKINNLQELKKFKLLDKVPLYSKILRYELGPDYREYLNLLLNNDIITTDNYYRVGFGNNKVAKSKCYGINPKHVTGEKFEYEIKQTCLVKKIVKWRESQMANIKDGALLEGIYGMMDKITIDIDASTAYLDDLLKKKKITPHARDLEYRKCMKIHNKNTLDPLFLTKDNYGRVHTNFTNISKHIRENFLYINGEKAIGIDIKSSQPALLHCVFKDYIDTVKGTQSFTNNNFLEMEVLDGTPIDIRDKYVSKNNSYSGDHIYDGYVNYSLDTFGFDSYKDMVESAERELAEYKLWLETDIYTEFCSRMDKPISRASMKKQFVTHIFSTGWGEYLSEIRQIWFKFFPTLHKILSSFKKEDYKNVAYRLQRDESSFIYGDLYNTLRLSGIDTFTTVHDSIIVPQSKVEDAKNLFNVVLKRNNIPTVAVL